jgi:hypothetical protein
MTLNVCTRQCFYSRCRQVYLTKAERTPCTRELIIYSLLLLLSPSLFYLLVHSRCRGCLFSLDHTQAQTIVGRTPLDEGSARRRDLYLTAQTLYKTNIHAPGGIPTHDPSKHSAADLRLRPRGHWDRQLFILVEKFLNWQKRITNRVLLPVYLITVVRMTHIDVQYVPLSSHVLSTAVIRTCIQMNKSFMMNFLN